MNLCKHGARDHTSGRPTQNSTVFYHINLALSKQVLQRCVAESPCCEQQHTCDLERDDHYLWDMVTVLVAEVSSHCRSRSGDPWFDIYWKCRACQHGTKKGGEHSYEDGCKFQPGRLPAPPGGIPTPAGKKHSQANRLLVPLHQHL